MVCEVRGSNMPGGGAELGGRNFPRGSGTEKGAALKGRDGKGMLLYFKLGILFQLFFSHSI